MFTVSVGIYPQYRGIESRRNSASYNPRLREVRCISNTACAFAHTSARTRARSAPPRVSVPILPPRKGDDPPWVPSLVRWNKCTGVGLWRVIVRTITRPAGGAVETQLAMISSWPAEGGTGDRLGSTAGEGQECILKGPGVFRSVSRRVAGRDTSNSACLPKGPIVTRSSFTRATISRLRVHQSAFCFRRGGHPPPQDRGLVFALRERRLSKTKFSNRWRTDTGPFDRRAYIPESRGLYKHIFRWLNIFHIPGFARTWCLLSEYNSSSPNKIPE